jgi:hypothetical protein
MPVMGGDRSDAGLVVALLGPVEVGLADGGMAPVAQPRLRVLLGLLGVVEGRMVTANSASRKTIRPAAGRRRAPGPAEDRPRRV